MNKSNVLKNDTTGVLEIKKSAKIAKGVLKLHKIQIKKNIYAMFCKE